MLYHAGENTTAGHWAAGVSQPIPVHERKARAKEKAAKDKAAKEQAWKDKAARDKATKDKMAKDKATKAKMAAKDKAKFEAPPPQHDDITPTRQYYFCSDRNIYPYPTTGDENPLTANPYLKHSSEMNAVVMMYERIRLPKMVNELVRNLSTTYYGGGKKDKDGGAKRKETDDEADDEGLRRSKRLRARK